MPKPLDGIRIVEISQVYSLPFAGMMLAELGADVIKVENPRSPEVVRTVGWRRGGVPASFMNLNRGKRFVGIDATTADGREVLAELVARADVLLDNLRPGKMEKLGLAWDVLAQRHPSLISASVTGFGEDGPWCDLACYDFVVQAMVGMVDFQRDPVTGTVDLIRHYVVDKTVAHTVVEGVLAALLMRTRTGHGDRVSVNMLDVGAHFFWPDGMIPYTYVGDVDGTKRDGAPVRVYPTVDGAVVMMPSLHPWAELCCVMGRHDLVDDQRFADRTQLPAHVDELLSLVGDGLSVLSTAEVLARCAEFDVAVGRVDTRPQLFDNEQAMWNKTASIHDLDTVGATRIPRPPWRFDKADVTTVTSINVLGGDTCEVLRELGVSADRLAALVESGAVWQG